MVYLFAEIAVYRQFSRKGNAVTDRKLTIVYVSVEMMIPELGEEACTANFRGGLGDLAGHTIEGLVKSGINVVPITLLYTTNWQTGKSVDYTKTPALRHPHRLDVEIHWKKESTPIWTINRAGATVFGLSHPNYRLLYSGDKYEKLDQAAFLGRAVPTLLRQLQIQPDILWCQEWMTALCIPNMRDDPYFADCKSVFTVHTAARGALENFPVDVYDRMAIDHRWYGHFVLGNSIRPTEGGIKCADSVTGVSKQFGELCQMIFSDDAHKIHGIMNGTSRDFFLSPHVKRYREEPNMLQLQVAHDEDKRELLSVIEAKTGVRFDTHKLLVGAVRRLADYKNQLPMFAPIIDQMCAPRPHGYDAQVFLAGVAHENDPARVQWMEEFRVWMERKGLKNRFVYIPEYSERLRTLAARGCDLWVSCPWEANEACGTSDFVAKINGNPNLASCGGGIMEHGREFDPVTRQGDTLFITPYSSETMEIKTGWASRMYYNYIEHDDDRWPTLRMNNYVGGKELDITHMVRRYEEECFRKLITY